MSKAQTDHSFLLSKINLRINHLPKDDPVRVLDAFCGNGVIWDYVKKKTGRDIKVLGIDKKIEKFKGYLALMGVKNVAIKGEMKKHYLFFET